MICHFDIGIVCGRIWRISTCLLCARSPKAKRVGRPKLNEAAYILSDWNPSRTDSNRAMKNRVIDAFDVHDSFQQCDPFLFVCWFPLYFSFTDLFLPESGYILYNRYRIRARLRFLFWFSSPRALWPLPCQLFNDHVCSLSRPEFVCLFILLCVPLLSILFNSHQFKLNPKIHHCVYDQHRWRDQRALMSIDWPEV